MNIEHSYPGREDSAPHPRCPNLLFIVLALFIPYAAWFVWSSSFVIDGTRYFCLFDDAMISMRYAKNAAAGFGLVWNRGEVAIEGYTNPLWTVLMMLPHLLSIPAAKISLVVQVASIACLIANLWFVQQLADRLTSGSRGFTFAAILLVAFYYPLNYWAIEGMEVGLLAAIVSGLALLAIRSIDEEAFHVWVYVLMGIGLLTRIDMVVPSVVVWIFLLLLGRKHRRQHLLAGGLAIAGTLGATTWWRWMYYQDWLPNTYYLKMEGYPAWARITRGIIRYGFFLWCQNILLTVMAFWTVARQPTRVSVLLATMFLAQSAYSIYVGGDAWEWFGIANRYVSIVMPLFLVLLSGSACALWRRWEHEFRDVLNRLRLSQRIATAFGAFVFLTVLTTLQTFDGNVRNLLRLVFIDEPMHTSDNRNKVQSALLIRRITEPDARIAVLWAGSMPYFADRPAIDILGKSDRRIARLAMDGADKPGLWHFYPGHLKWDYAYSIGELRPDVVTGVWRRPDDAKAVLALAYEERLQQQIGQDFYLRSASTRIRWDEVARLEKQTR